MALFKFYSTRARRAIFFAHWQAKKEGAKEITPEHILSGLLKEDPGLFAILMPKHVSAAKELETQLTVGSSGGTTDAPYQESLPLSPGAKKVVFASYKAHERLGHSSVGTQHLLMGLLQPIPKRRGWLRSREASEENLARRILLDHGLTAAEVEAKTKAGIVTPLTSVLDDPLIKLNAQLAALGELLISKSIFTRTEFVAMLDQNAEPIGAQFYLTRLLDALFEKSKINIAELDKLKSENCQAAPQE
jgi:ATP-dependent Clp protease ATP-binding subunit ClpA